MDRMYGFGLRIALVVALNLKILRAASDESGNLKVTADLFYQPGIFSDKNVESGTGPSLWPDRKAIPYYISSEFDVPEQHAILQALRTTEKITGGCIFFKPRTDESDFIYFLGNFQDLCDSSVGRRGGLQYIHLARAGIFSTRSCLDTGSIQHEVMHTLGFYHEHERPDRDHYINIRYDNIQFDQYNNFAVESSMYTFGVKYDYHSVVQYEAFGDPINPLIPVIVPKTGLVVRMGRDKRMSPSDIAKIALAYKCPLTIFPGSLTASESQNFPNFSLEPLTEDQCQLQFNAYCASDLTTQTTCGERNYFRVVCQSDAAVPVLESMAFDMAKDLLRPASIQVDEQIIDEYLFAPISTQVLKLQLRNCFTDRVTHRLNQLNFVNLLHFELHHCHDLVVQKTDFMLTPRLRIIILYNSTVSVLEPGSFTDLSELRVLSLEALSDSQKNYNFEPTYRDYLRRLHCSCKFAGYRSWWRSNKQLRLRVKKEEIYSFDGPTFSLFSNDDFNKEDLYHPINCDAEPFPLSTEWINYYAHVEYSINDPQCRLTPTVTSTAAPYTTLIVNPTTASTTTPTAAARTYTTLIVNSTTTTASATTDAVVPTTLSPWKIRPLTLAQNKLSAGSVTGIVLGVLLGVLIVSVGTVAVIAKGRCAAWWTSLRNGESIWRAFRNRKANEDYGVAFTNEISS
ncbi:uncharacterized protein LOC129589593 [Paramacrobiotus metropolitanus]|uniref:uncharacterized protein LOC129589593 n=1 Tax=Paramacrobiotus metropolitanus TaxID=2943436 RepID=UPI00244608DE|nr:uncharacterized protein LOC129589593 [Paramacrobiotus metropolitanus]